MHLTHSETIKTFQDAVRHLELEEDRIKLGDVKIEVHASNSGYVGKRSNKNRRGFKGKGSAPQPKRQQTE